MSTTLFVPLERPVRDYISGLSLGQAGTYVGLPSDALFPAIEVVLLDSGIAEGQAPQANAAFSFNVWAAGATGAEREAAAAVAYKLASHLQSTEFASLSSGALSFLGAAVSLGPVPRHDPDGRARYVLDAALTLVKVT